ncbi:MAG: bifunctional metallophosphatase/5'-nucleotidase [Cellvibrio sp.]|uniref:bifunctional metallophosphatase/5'-nucleotidase n=1 Tax=Cellvibrio sp. TaxID=1965322 RepID=UPI0031A9AA71
MALSKYQFNRLINTRFISTAIKTAFATGLIIGLGACTHSPSSSSVNVSLVALNDFHGYIQASTYTYADPKNPTQQIATPAGGIAALSGLLTELSEQDPQLLFVGVGDLIRASPPVSAMWADEPSINALNLLGLEFSTLGNHELDEGKAELLRQVHGGCESPRPDKACKYATEFKGATFPYIAANLIDSTSGQPVFAPYLIKEIKGVKIAFIGAEVEELASVIPASSMKGIRVLDEAEAINRYVPEIQRQGVKAIVALVHQGGKQQGSFNGCDNFSGDIVDIAQRLDPEIDVLLSAHTHQSYVCKLGKLLISQGASYGHLVTHLNLTLNQADGEITNAVAENILVDPNRYRPTPAIAAFEQQLVERSKSILEKPIARIGVQTINRVANTAGESAMGDLIADAQLAATKNKGAQIAFMNSGGIRSDLSLGEGKAQVVFSQVSAVHPFKGTLQVMNLSGAQLKSLLEQQWQAGAVEDFRPLQISRSFSYQWDATRPLGNRVIAESLRVNGQLVKADNQYRITTNSFLADGGDKFSVFTQGSEREDSAVRDLDALIDYLQAQEKAGKPAGQAAPEKRIQRVN